MATRVIVGIVALACISICGLVATLANFELVDKVNDKLPKDKQFATARLVLVQAPTTPSRV
jgi:hypothetical protein